MSIITDVYAREVLDSRGNPTLEVEVYTESGATIPSILSIFSLYTGILENPCSTISFHTSPSVFSESSAKTLVLGVNISFTVVSENSNIL